MVGQDAEDRAADGVVLVGPNGEQRRLTGLDLSPQYRGGSTIDPYFPLQSGSLSPEGTRLALAYGGKVVVHTLATGADTTYPTGGHTTESLSWTADGTALVLGDDAVLHLATQRIDTGVDRVRITGNGLSGFAPWGLLRTVHGQRAQTFFADHLDVVDAGVTNPQAIVTEGAQQSILAIPYGPDTNGRFKGCCAVASWLDESTVAFESVGATYTILAWNDVTGQVRRVTELVRGPGGYPMATTYADWSR
jgi:hypothetical protein